MPVRSPGQDGDPPPGEDQIAAGRTRLGYLRAGTGEHPVVFLHGWPQTSHAWRRVLPLLEASCSAVALDLPGVGRSSPQAGGFDKATMARDVHAAFFCASSGGLESGHVR
jgi:pimeloyl-ACP methyl ester carboxylesterase